MKKTLIICALLATSVLSGFAQLKVDSVGTVLSGGSTYRQSSFQNAKINFESKTTNSYTQDNVAIQGSVNFAGQNSSNNKAVGVFGIAGNGANGHNMGVLGYLGGNNYGAAVVGSQYGNLDFTIPGYYAGYFYGPVYSTHAMSATAFNINSDLRLKKNVVSVTEDEGDYKYLDRILDMNVIKYNFIDRFPGESRNKRKEPSIEEQRHIGLAAQELQKLFPEVVTEGQDGYLCVNYMELVPVLIRSIQELKQELDARTQQDSEAKTRGINDENAQVKTSAASVGNVLYQNTPNPFKEKTTIRFSLADDAKDAAICIFDLTGKMLKKMPVTQGMTSVSIGGYELGEGMFLYTLMISGQEIDTKRMIITK